MAPNLEFPLQEQVSWYLEPKLKNQLRNTSTQAQAVPLQELVEAQGHLIDSHIMEQIFDTVVEFGGRFEVEQFRIGRTNSDASYLRLKSGCR